jgi:hypothetical protein
MAYKPWKGCLVIAAFMALDIVRLDSPHFSHSSGFPTLVGFVIALVWAQRS